MGVSLIHLCEKEQLPVIDAPFLAHLNGNGGEFVIINKDKDTERAPDFSKRWSGVLLAAEKPQDWKHNANEEWLSKDAVRNKKICITIFAFVFFAFLSQILSFNWVSAGLMLIAIAGIFVSWMIVTKDLGIENKIADQVCGKDADCNAVIHSDKAKLAVGIDWSDAGIIYFSFLWLSLLITSFINTAIYAVLAALKIVTGTFFN